MIRINNLVMMHPKSKWITLVLMIYSQSILSQNVEIMGKLGISTLSPNEGSQTILALDSFGFIGQRSAISLGVPMTGLIMSYDSTNISLTNAGFNKVGKFQVSHQQFLQTGSFSELDTLNAPYVGGCAVWTGNEMLVWGGSANSGAKYDPQTNTWTTISASGEPTPRSGYSCVWTGTNLLIWGGIDDNQNLLANGAKYNPTSDTWSNLSTINVPVARVYHSSIWTGSEMIIFGGMTSVGINPNLTSAGARYNPVSDTWTATSLSNTPAPTVFHSAVWAHDQMIVYGGLNNFIIKKYNPITDTWTNGGNSDIRGYHTAVWTGSKMIVWGGIGTGNIPKNTGHIYDPTTNTLTNTSLGNAPSARLYHSSTWTGKEMIVWGGSTNVNGTNTLGNGAKFNPVTNTWITMSNINPPSPRCLHASVWTGNHNIIWGGIDSANSPLKTGCVYDVLGGIYEPSSNVDLYIYQKSF